MTDTQMEKTEDYLSGKMSPEDQRNFERELETDPVLAAVFNTYRAIETQMRNDKRFASADSVRSTLTKLGADFLNPALTANDSTSPKEKPVSIKAVQPGTLSQKWPRVNSIRTWKLVAAVFTGMIITGTWYVVTNKKNTNEQVVTIPKNEYDSITSLKKGIDTSVTPNPAPPLLVIKDTVNNSGLHPLKNIQQRLLAEKHFEPDTAPEDVEGPLEDAFEQYEQKQFAKAAATFESADLTVSTRSEGTDTALTMFYAFYYKALSYMAIKRYVKAIPLLKNLTGPNGLLQAKVQWYLALAYLSTGNTSKATSLLGEIDKNSKAGAYRLKANKLILELTKQR